MKDEIISTGIDIGTTTTQLIFSRLRMKNTGGFGSVPKVEVVSKEIIYRSPIYFTPLIQEETIDAGAVEMIVKNIYTEAGMQPKDIDTGAVIITGETARKRNAREVVAALSEVAGDFVVAAAGPDLESVLSGKGSGAAALSKETGKLVANLDIGGGTTNISYFLNGEVVDTACLNIGGRLVKIQDHKIHYLSPAIKPFLTTCEMPIAVGDALDDNTIHCLELIATHMAQVMAESVDLVKKSDSLLDQCITNHGITWKEAPEIIVFSGGVAACMKHLQQKEHYSTQFFYGDMGILLAQAILSHPAFQRIQVHEAMETLNATVVGAGNYSMEVSGSTITYQNQRLPRKNLPVYAVKWQRGEDLADMKQQLRLMRQRIAESETLHGEDSDYVVTFVGPKCPDFTQIETMAECLQEAFAQEIQRDQMPMIVVEHDMGKALGQAIRRRIGKEKSLICIDGVCCKEGDFVDVGVPLVDGQVIPVVVKTLIFEK